MTSLSTIRTQAERADQTRARILEAAVREFSSKGLAGARTGQIAEAAGVNKALLYYYFKGKEALYAAALESVVEEARANTISVLETDASPGERFVRVVLSHFDRCYSNPVWQSLMHQEMVRIQRGEEKRLDAIAQNLFRPLWVKVEELLEQGIASGELIPVEPSQIRYASLGANVFYFLSAPITGVLMGKDLLEQVELERRRRAAVEYLGQTIFLDRQHGAQVAARVLAAAPAPRKAIPKRNWN